MATKYTMILSYIKDKKPHVKVNVVKYWKGAGTSNIKFQLKNGEVIEVMDTDQCFITEDVI